MYGSIRRIPGEMDKNCCIVFSFKARSLQAGRDGLVGYDAALTQLRSGVRFPLFVFCFWTSCISLAFAVYNHELGEAIIMRNEAELPITYTRVLYVIYSSLVVLYCTWCTPSMHTCS